LYRNTITNIICDKFGAERKHTSNGNILIFDPEKLVRVGKTYNIETDIQTKVVENEGYESSEGSLESGASYMQNRDITNINNLPVDYKKSYKNETGITNSTIRGDNKESVPLGMPSLLSQPSLREEERLMPGSVYRLYGDTWGCRNCNLRDDIHFMKLHVCRGVKK
jgi:hypothetical protein